MRNITAASVQFESGPGDKPANLAAIRRFVESAARRDVDLIVFPECCITGYWFLRHVSRDELAAVAEPIFDGPSARCLISLAREFRMTIGAGLIEAAERRKALQHVRGRDAGRHRAAASKDSRLREPDLTCGSEFTVFDTPQGFRAGVLICYDCNLIENVRIAALARAPKS